MTARAFVLCAPSMGFPEGLAPTARVTQYAQMLMAMGLQVTVICPAPSERHSDTAQNREDRGVHKGIRFWYPAGVLRSDSFLTRRLRSARAWLRIVSAIARVRPAIVLLYPMYPTAALFALGPTKAAGGRLLCDESELPEIHSGGGFFAPFRARSIAWSLRHADGVVAISPALRERLRTLAAPAPVVCIPVVIDAQDFPPPPTHDGACVVLYMGPLNQRKDGVETLLRAFAALSRTHPQATLTLCGDADRERAATYRGRVADLGISAKVVFLGRVSRSELLAHVQAASVLVLPRPDSQQNRANMPTKLVEYLASGRPVVATRVGLVSAMVTEDEAVLVAPDDPAALTAGMTRVIDNPAAAAALGEAGRRRALAAHDYHAHVQTLEALALLRGGPTR